MATLGRFLVQTACWQLLLLLLLLPTSPVQQVRFNPPSSSNLHVVNIPQDHQGDKVSSLRCHNWPGCNHQLMHCCQLMKGNPASLANQHWQSNSVDSSNEISTNDNSSTACCTHVYSCTVHHSHLVPAGGPVLLLLCRSLQWGEPASATPAAFCCTRHTISILQTPLELVANAHSAAAQSMKVCRLTSYVLMPHSQR
jgi:hypothetical protein